MSIYKALSGLVEIIKEKGFIKVSSPRKFRLRRGINANINVIYTNLTLKLY